MYKTKTTILSTLIVMFCLSSTVQASAEPIAVTSLNVKPGLVLKRRLAPPATSSARSRAGNSVISGERRKCSLDELERARALRRAGNIEAAMVSLLKATKEDPTNLEAYYEQALLFRDEKKFKLAASRLEQALAIDPSYQKARILLAAVRLEQGDVGEAVQELSRSLGLNMSKKRPTGHNSLKRLRQPPPMILQSIHSSLPTSSTGSASSNRHSSESGKLYPLIKQDKISKRNSRRKFSLLKHKKRLSRKRHRRRKKKHLSRHRIRKAIARKYKSFHRKRKGGQSKRYPRKYWFRRLLTWSDSFMGAGRKRNRRGDEKKIKNSIMPAVSSEIDKKSLAKLLNVESDLRPKKEIRKGTTNATGKKEPPVVLRKQVPVAVAVMPSPPSDQRAAQPDTPATYSSPAERQSSADTRLWQLNQRTASPRSIFTDRSNDLQVPGGLAALNTRLAWKNNRSPEPQTKKESAVAQQPVDEWTERLRYLNEHGTGSLKRGEAFMFSEDTGEAVLFLADGRRIRRKIAASKNADEVVRMRRPDILIPKELLYDLSLAGKIMQERSTKVDKHTVTSENADNIVPPTFRMEKMLEEENGVMNWLKDLFHI